jgi:predicted amidophosphoribosyltransferase
MQCAQCQHSNRDAATFCETCGTRLAHVCLRCGHDISPQAKFCEECGTALTVPIFDHHAFQSMRPEAEPEGRFHALVLAVMATLQRERRVTYRRLKYLFALDPTLTPARYM